MRESWRAFRIAMQFLTRIPMPGGGGDLAEHARLLPRATTFFPLVGSIIGLLTASVIWSAAQCWSWPIAVLLGLAFEAWMTGAFHEDAVADFCDAFGGGWSREQILEILRDSRVGSFGTVGLGLALSLRAAGLMMLPHPWLFPVLIASTTFGRWIILPTMAWLPPVPSRAGLSRDVGSQIGWWSVGLGSILAMPGCAYWIFLEPTRFVMLLIVSSLLLIWFVHYVKRRIGGITGDCLGTICYFVQVLTLLIASAQPTN